MRVEKTFRQKFGAVVERYMSFAKEHNDAQVETKATMLREPHLSKFKTVASLYLKEFWHRMNSPLWEEAVEIPLMTITRADLANLTGCRRRTVQDHLARLSHYGVIYVEDSDPTQGYNIAVNPYFLLGDEQAKPEIKNHSFRVGAIKKHEKNPFALPKRQTLPHSIEEKENIYNSYIAEGVQNDPKERHQEICQEKQEIATPLENIQISGEEICQEKTLGAPEQKESEISSDERFQAYKEGRLHKLRYQKAPVTPIRQITDVEKRQIVDSFWRYAKDVFYPERNFNPIENDIKKVIYQDVFGSFRAKTLEESTYEFWQIQNLRLQYWVDKKQAFDARKDRKPYHPTAYFSKAYGNPQKQGFLVVLEWDKKAQKSLKELEFERELDKAKMFMLQFPYTLPKGQKDKIKDITQLAQYLGRKLTVRTNSDYVQKFNTFLTTTNFSAKWKQPQPQPQPQNGS